MTGSRSTSEWIVRHNQNPRATLNLFCFPHAGAGASMFRRWHLALPEDVQVLAVQPPGRENRYREPGLNDLQQLADQATDALRPTLREGPFALYGHSLGSLLAFEVARRLHGEATPTHLLASGRNAPQCPNRAGPNLWDDETLIGLLRRLDGTAGSLLSHREFLEMFLPVFRIDYQAYAGYAYRPGPRLRCPITAFAGAQDPETQPDGVRAWAEQTTVGFEMFVVPGNHFFPISHEEVVVQLVAARLAAV
jgi:surfactin synthase thioesterase subunit